MGLTTLLLLLDLVPCARADSLDDFANNFATDLTPLVALFGEQVTKQFLSESLSRWDNVIFAMAPLGILTAVVSVIRVCGSPSLKAFIGRAQEGQGNAEIELLSSTSESIGEIWNDGGIARVFGNPQILEVVKWEATGEDYYETATDKFGSAGVALFDESVKLNIWKKADIPRSRGSDVEAISGSPHRPNLSLNVGIKRQDPLYARLAAAVGVALQVGVLAFAGLAVYRFPVQFRRNGKLVAAWAFPLVFSGITMVSFGMFLCAYIIETTTREDHYKQSKTKSRIFWCQTDGQKLGDQVFPAFIGCSDDHRYVKSRKTERHQTFGQGRRAGRFEDILLWTAVCITISGFVIQFVGLRAMNSSIAIAQLGATLVMAVIRASLRTRRRGGNTNLLSTINARKKISGHELDQLAMELEEVETIQVAACAEQSDYVGFSLQGSENVLKKTRELEVVSKRQRAMVGQELDPTSHKYPVPNRAAKALKVRARLARLTGPDMGPQAPWSFEVRRKAHQLERAIESVMNTLFAGTTTLNDGWIGASDFYWAIQVRSIPKVGGENGAMQAQGSDEKCYLHLSRSWEADVKTRSPWRACASEIEAILGLWTWSILLSGGCDDVPTNRLIAFNTETDLEEAKIEYRLWIQDLTCQTVCVLKKQTVNGPEGGTQNLFFGTNIPLLSEISSEATSSTSSNKGVVSSSHGCLVACPEANVLFAPTGNSALTMCAQDVFVSFLAGVLNAVDKINGTTVIRGGDIKEVDPFLFNTQLDKMADDFERSGLGSREDAYLCIVPTLKRASKLPIIDAAIPAARDLVKGYKVNDKWNEAEKLLLWIRRHCSVHGCKDAETELGDLYTMAMRNRQPKTRRMGVNGIITMLSGKRKDGPTAEIATIANQYGWIGLRIAAEIAAQSESPEDADIADQLMKAGAREDFISGYNDNQNLIDWTRDANDLDPGGQNRMTVARYLLGRRYTDVNMNDVSRTPLYWAANRGDADMAWLLLENGAGIEKTCLRTAAVNGHERVVRLLLEKGADVMAAEENGQVALHYAAEFGHEAVVGLLLEKGADIMAEGEDGQVALHYASRHGHGMVVELLLAKGCDVKVRDRWGEMALHKAAYGGHEVVVRLLLEGTCANTNDSVRDVVLQQALGAAASGGHERVVMVLLERNFDINTRNSSGSTTLHEASRHGHEGVVRMLLERPIDINMRDSRGSTALHEAGSGGRETVVDLLLKLGADVETKNDTGSTALIEASYHGHVAVVKLLLEKGSGVNVADYSGDTALHKAVDACQKPVVQLLLEHGAAVDLKNADGRTPLSVVTSSSRPDLPVVKLLLEKKADVNGRDNAGETALITAARYGNTALVALLIENGADVETKNQRGRTALHTAAISGHSDVAELLLAKGAALEAKDADGATPLSLASEKGMMKLVQLLVDRGARTES